MEIKARFKMLKLETWSHVEGTMTCLLSLPLLPLILYVLLPFYNNISGPLDQWFFPTHPVLLSCLSLHKLRDTGRKEQSWYSYLFHLSCISYKFLHGVFRVSNGLCCYIVWNFIDSMNSLIIVMWSSLSLSLSLNLHSANSVIKGIKKDYLFKYFQECFCGCSTPEEKFVEDEKEVCIYLHILSLLMYLG